MLCNYIVQPVHINRTFSNFGFRFSRLELGLSHWLATERNLSKLHSIADTTADQELEGGKRSVESYDQFKSVKLQRAARPGVALLEIKRPRTTFNALTQDTLREISAAGDIVNRSNDIRALVVTGTGKSFASGADISELQNVQPHSLDSRGDYHNWSCISRISKPVIAAVRGIALGGGCELAMSADIIYAGQSAKFGLPEIKLAIIPGAGGTQRLVRAIGKSSAMEMILTGAQITADDAYRVGLISRVVPDDQVVEKALDTAENIASYSNTAACAAKKAINAAFEMHLSDGLDNEWRSFKSLFESPEPNKYITAFLEQRRHTNRS